MESTFTYFLFSFLEIFIQILGFFKDFIISCSVLTIFLWDSIDYGILFIYFNYNLDIPCSIFVKFLILFEIKSKPIYNNRLKKYSYSHSNIRINMGLFNYEIQKGNAGNVSVASYFNNWSC